MVDLRGSLAGSTGAVSVGNVLPKRRVNEGLPKVNGILAAIWYNLLACKLRSTNGLGLEILDQHK